LVDRALAAADDEVRHARLTRSLARRFVAKENRRRRRPPREQGVFLDIRPLEVVAAENVAEGCLRETFGAVVAAFQAQVAEDPHVRRVMRRIARDEARHAQLAIDVATWAKA